MAAVSDGAGSASQSHTGSAEAAQAVLGAILLEAIDPAVVSEDIVRLWVEKTRAHLDQIAEDRCIPVEQLACTLLFAVVDPQGGLFVQVGDGAWVVEQGDDIRCATWPQNGEYANQTTFLTSDAALRNVQISKIKGPITSLAGFTDGLQGLALDFNARQPHRPFFRPLFDAMRSNDDESVLTESLLYFLGTPQIAERTDDDVTLLLATWCEPGSASDATV